jgi:pSer/pThr/pTyr-binding forkhead associated (FHA) protein
VENQPPDESTPPGVLEIEVTGGPAAGARIPVEQELVIGRQTGGAGQFPDAELSRQHARIARQPGEDYQVEDLGSSNGTFVNGLRISAPTLLSIGDAIELGATTLVVRTLPAPAGSSPEAPAARAPAAQSHGTRAPRSSSAGAAATPPTLAVRLEVDFEAGTATVALDEGGDVVTMSFLDGNWRAT